MRITIIQGAFFPVPPTMGGAVEKVWFALGKEFARRGHEVTHISRAMPDRPVDETIDGVRHRRVRGSDQPRSLLRLKLADFAYSLRVRRVLPRADILVTNTFWLPLLVRTETNGRVYVHVQRAPKGQMRWYAHVARLLAVSHAIRDAIISEAPALEPKVRVLPNCLPFSFPMSLDYERPKKILYVGRIHPEKGLELFLRAMALLPETLLRDWSVEMVGPHSPAQGGGGEKFLQELQKLGERLPLRIEWSGPVFEEAALIARYQAASVFVYPSVAETGEALPVAPLEAMANGCVAVLSGLACFEDYVVDGVNGFVFDHRTTNPEATLAERMQTVLQMKAAERGTVGRAAHARAAQFAPGPVAQRYLEDFASLLAPKRM